MPSNTNDLSRRDFLTAAAVAGAGAVLGAAGKIAVGQTAPATKPVAPPPSAVGKPVGRREFGKSGVEVAMLSLGGIFDIAANQLMLTQALKWGVDYWDTAAAYPRGSERGIGMFLEANPAERKRVFLVTKAKDADAAEMEASLDASLGKLRTNYVDMFFVHGVGGPDRIASRGDEWKALAAKLKAAGKIRLFGFSAHSNMAESLQAAAKAGFIDGIMLAYNFRVMNGDAMTGAVEAAQKAGIGLTAMKTQGRGSRSQPSEAEIAMIDRFTAKGFKKEQAALKAVWSDERISAVCSQMTNLSQLQDNYLAAIDKTTLSAADREAMVRYAGASCSQYCAGCANICESATAGSPPIADVMRYLMYHGEYGSVDEARRLFAKLPPAARRLLARADYSLAERRCPQHMAIGELMRQAGRILA